MPDCRCGWPERANGTIHRSSRQISAGRTQIGENQPRSRETQRTSAYRRHRAESYGEYNKKRKRRATRLKCAVWDSLGPPKSDRVGYFPDVFPMYIRRKADKAVWINAHSNLNGWQIDRERRKTDPANARYLKVVDVALRPRETQ